MDPRQKAVLQRLSNHLLTTVDMSDQEILAVRQLARKGLARDYADFYRRRTPTHLRIWGITPAGKAILSQQAQSHTFTKRTQLDFGLATTELKPPEQMKIGAKLHEQIRVRIRSTQPPEGLKIIRPYRFNQDKDKQS